MKELCTNCGDETGRAGKGEDSLYAEEGTNQEYGPLCEECYRLAQIPPHCDPDTGIDFRHQ